VIAIGESQRRNVWVQHRERERERERENERERERERDELIEFN
jgi:hypothetical protein